jgi:hypothetical protein
MENPPVFTPQLDTGNFRILSLFRFCYAELEGGLQISAAMWQPGTCGQDSNAPKEWIWVKN